MGKMISCMCGWTLVSPSGESDIKKHAMMHMQDAHAGMSMSEEEMMKMIKSV
jgi:predicted small metal-binding protein